MFTQTPQTPRTPSIITACLLKKLHNGRLCRPMSFAGRPPKDGSLLPASNNHRRFSPFSGCGRLMLFSSAVIEGLPPVERIHRPLYRQNPEHQVPVSKRPVAVLHDGMLRFNELLLLQQPDVFHDRIFAHLQSISNCFE